MKIVHYFDVCKLERGGTIRAALDMCAVMARRGHGVTLLTYDDADAPAEWRRARPGETGADGDPVVVVAPRPARPGGFFSSAQVKSLDPALRSADVLHTHGVWIPNVAQVAARARSLGVPHVISIHGMLDDWSMSQRSVKKRLYLAIKGGKYLRGAAALQATADDEKRQASRWAPGDRMVVIPYITDLGPFKELPGSELARRALSIPDDGVPNVLFLSRVHYKKQPDVLIRAGGLLRDRGTPVRVLIAGTGEKDYLDELAGVAGSAGLDDGSCRFLGMVTGKTKVSLYQLADVFALPTSQENFGLVYTESLACGTPVVATKGTDIWRELESSGAAAIADGAPGAFADAISRLLADRAALAAMGSRGREWVVKWLDPDDLGARFEAMYERAAATRAANGGGGAGGPLRGPGGVR